MKPTLLTSIAIACSLTHWACAPAKPSPRSSPKAEHAECEGSGTQRWDLGAGRLEDIAEYAPDFYDFSSPSSNYERLFRLKIAALPTGVARTARDYHGSTWTEFESTSPEEEGIFVFATKERGTGILIAASSCPHVVVEERCASGSIVTKVASEGELPCFDGISGSFSIRALGDPSLAHVVPGGAVWLRRSDLKEVDLTVSRGRRTVFEGTVPVDRFAKVSPAVLRGVLQHADDREGFRAFMTLAPQWRTPQLPEEVATLRMKRLTERLASSEDPVSIRGSMYLDERYPGTREVREAIDSRLRGEFARLLDTAPSAGGFWRGTKIIDALGDATSDNEKFLAVYGPFVAEGHMQIPPEEAATLDTEFVKRWPRAAWAPQIIERQEKQAVERQIAREKSQQTSQLDDLFSELADVGNLVVTWQYKVQWLQKYGPKIRRTEIGVSNMKAGIQLKKQEFCTLKKEFLKVGSAADFKERAKAHCDNEAPVEDLGSGEVDLTKECRVQFASGC